ncbi:hypothetical protein A4A49_46779 [Nicotiana attenuata]|uniref:Uncharacterized protein n=1 Tax=Nicotiana attenuata TaxID=49451 RepID=A0A314L9S0_NICAT|nr:hypothetical protein A4A49_46779 [Nicotiana attenuata]
MLNLKMMRIFTMPWNFFTKMRIILSRLHQRRGGSEQLPKLSTEESSSSEEIKEENDNTYDYRGNHEECSSSSTGVVAGSNSSSTHYKLHELLAQSRDEESHQVDDEIMQLANDMPVLDTPD